MQSKTSNKVTWGPTRWPAAWSYAAQAATIATTVTFPRGGTSPSLSGTTGPRRRTRVFPIPEPSYMSDFHFSPKVVQLHSRGAPATSVVDRGLARVPRRTLQGEGGEQRRRHDEPQLHQALLHQLSLTTNRQSAQAHHCQVQGVPSGHKPWLG